MILEGLLLYQGTLWARKRLRKRQVCARDTCVYVTELNDTPNNLNVRVDISTNQSEDRQYEHTRRLDDVMTLVLIIELCPLSLLIDNHPIPCLSPKKQ